MRVEPRWISEADLVRINALILEGSTERHRVRDAGLVANAVGAPQNSFHYGGVDDLLELAARLMQAVALGHAFEQGNKRTAFFAGTTFLELNGATVTAPDSVEIAKLVEDLVTHSIGVDVVAGTLRPYVVLPAYTSRLYL